MQTGNYMYISQGRSGLISTDSTQAGINGLYTDKFTTCVILACIGLKNCSKKASFLHVDSLSLLDLPQISRVLDWVGENSNVFVIHKDAGKLSADSIVTFFMGKYNFKLIPAQDAHHNVTLSIKSNGEFDLQVSPEDSKPENIYYHPDERKCMAVRTIGQIVGKPAFREDGYKPKQQQLVFDCNRWLSLSNQDLQIDETHSRTKEEMDILREKNENFHTLLNAVCEIISFTSNEIIEKLTRLSMTVSCIEDYLSNFQLDVKQVLKTNILESFNKLQPEEAAANPNDINFKNDMIAMLNENIDIDIDLISQLLTAYGINPETQYKKTITFYCKTFIIHYERRLFYKRLEENHVFLPPIRNSSSSTTSSSTLASGSGAAFYQPTFNKSAIINYLKLVTDIQDGWKGNTKSASIWVEYSDTIKLNTAASLLNQSKCCDAAVQPSISTGVSVLMIKNINQEKLQSLAQQKHLCVQGPRKL